jgi:hypothetical protein
LDGNLALSGAPSLLDMTARRGLNVAYAQTVEHMDKKERDAFDSELQMSMVELAVRELARKAREKEDRRRLAISVGEVG